MIKISVIVPCHNSEAFINATIESVINQKLKDWELILVDDGSSDKTWEIISKYNLIDHRISSYKKTNGGTSDTRNYGYSLANSESKYLFFLDHDDLLHPDTLIRLSTYLEETPEVGLVACQYFMIDERGKALKSKKSSRWVPGFIFPRKLKDEEFDTPFVTFFCATGQGPFAMYSRAVYAKTTGWETSFWPHEDTDMFCQMAINGKVHFLPDKLYYKRTHPAQGMNNFKRVQDSHGSFRKKWDNLNLSNESGIKMLRDAKRYYYSTHQPFRDLKVARKAFFEFLRSPDRKKLRWFLTLIKSSASGFLLERFKKY